MEEIRKQLLDLASLHYMPKNEYYWNLRSFLNGETELSLDEIKEAINNETEAIKNVESQTSSIEQIINDHVKNNKHELDEGISGLNPHNKREIKETLQEYGRISEQQSKITNITNNINKHNTIFKNGDTFKFSNGTSETRALHFISEGKGYTSLETPAYIPEQNIISKEGLQISLQGELDNRSVSYARTQASLFGDRPVIIEGEIPAQYVFDNYNHGGEYGIPKEYYDKISNATIKDAETGTPLYSLSDGKVNKLETYTDYNYPELKIKNGDGTELIQDEIKNKLNITEDISSEHALEIIDEALDNVIYANQKVLDEEGYLKNFERIVADFESGRTKEGDRGEYGIDYFRQQVKKEKEEVKLAKEKLEGLPKQEELEELRKLYNAQIKDLPLETVDLSDFKNRNTVRYHNSKDATIIYDISGMGDNIKIENSVGHSGTWASKQEHGIKSISNWIEYNPEILEYDKQNPEKLSGYITEFKYKEDANILYIHDDKTLKRTLNKYGDGRNKISWNKVASDFDAVRIDSNPLLSLSKYQRKVLDYYGDTDVIFNPDIFETINTYNADEYFREDKKPIFTANNKKNITSQEAFEKYGPDSDEFFTSQGLDPVEQRNTINELNSKRKPVVSDEEILNQLHKESEEAAEQFIKTTEESEQLIEKINVQLEDIHKPELEIRTIQEPNINFEQVLEETAKETVENSTQKLETKTIQSSAKNALNTKSLGVIAIGTTAALAGIAGISAHSKNEKKKKKEEQKMQNINESNNKYIDHNNDLMYANQVTNFSTGRYAYSL